MTSKEIYDKIREETGLIDTYEKESVLINKIEEEVCKDCKFYSKILGICRGECMPVQKAIARNLLGRGICDDVKKFVKEGKDERETES